jgi:hypothetical protein
VDRSFNDWEETIVAANVGRRSLAVATVAALALVLVVSLTGPSVGEPNKSPLLVEPAAPSSPWRVGGSSLSIGTGSQLVVAGPTTGAINVTHFSVAASPGHMGYFNLMAASVATSASDCENADVYEISYALNTVSTPVAVAFPTPFQVRPRNAQEQVCLIATVGGTGPTQGGSMSVNASGFYGN